eukprot:51090_1
MAITSEHLNAQNFPFHHTMRDVIYPLTTAITITSATILTLGATGLNQTVLLFGLWMFASQLIPWLTFLSYSQNNNSLKGRKLILFAAWFLVYFVFGNIVIYVSPRAPIFNTLWNPKYVLPLAISGMTLNHSIRMLAVLAGEDWFRIKNITTPCQAMFAFNASAIIIFKDNAPNEWLGRIKGLFDIFSHLFLDWVLLRIGAYLYHTTQYKEYIDTHPILYYELSAIYTALGVDFLINRVSWINMFVYGDSIDITYGMQYPVLSVSPREFWKRQTVYQREALKLGIFKPVLKRTGVYWLAVLMLFAGNYVVHTVMTFQMTFEYFGFYEWAVIFVILLVAVGPQLYIEKVVLKKYKMEYVKENWMYKAWWYMILHVVMASVVYMGVPKLVPMGLGSSFWWLDHWW